jgi:nucleoid-associated protein YgaU
MRAHPAGRAVLAGLPGSASSAIGAGPDRGASPERTPVRLTARGRRLVAALGLAFGVGAAALVGSALPGSSASTLHLAGQSSVVVRAGDTVWSIATSVAGDRDVRVVVDRIQALNGLHGSAITPGQVLRLP